MEAATDKKRKGSNEDKKKVANNPSIVICLTIIF
jgi:hypothetical protein